MSDNQKIIRHTELRVFKKAFDVSMKILKLSHDFPMEERYSLTDQIRRSSRSVCANIAEAWWKRRYEAAFISKLSDSEAEAAETQVWLQYCVKCNYVDREIAKDFYAELDQVLGMIVNMISHPDKWVFQQTARKQK